MKNSDNTFLYLTILIIGIVGIIAITRSKQTITGLSGNDDNEYITKKYLNEQLKRILCNKETTKQRELEPINWEGADS